jgi:hypothetical protein
MRQGCLNGLQHTFQLAVYPLIPKPQNSITVLVEISRSQPILALFLRVGMLTAVEFNNQVLRDAAEIGKVGTNPVLPTELKTRRGAWLLGVPTTCAPRKSTRHEDAGLDRADFPFRNS